MSLFVAGICLSLAWSGSPPAVFLPLERFTLAWTHSIEKVRWEEDYAVVWDRDQGWLLEALESRVQGSGAGMEPPPDARWRNGWFVYRPMAKPVKALHLSRSDFVPDYELCTTSGCRSLANHLPSDGGTTLVQSCRGSGVRSGPASGSSG